MMFKKVAMLFVILVKVSEIMREIRFMTQRNGSWNQKYAKLNDVSSSLQAEQVAF